MHLHILGISGTFMSALAMLARASGYTVTGSDENCYPPVSDLLISHGIQWTEGFEDTTDALNADCVIVGNTIKRGNPVLETVLDQSKAYTSGPQWLAEHILPKYRVLAVSGTHGKTTTTSMLAYILHHAGLEPGFLIGGVATDFQTSACLGKGPWFVIEADEYDSAFFDKRPKFMHYRPEVAILNNLEFDHADIYSDLAAIQQQFHYFLRTMPRKGLVIKPRDDRALNEVLARGQYSSLEETALNGHALWRATSLNDQGSAFQVYYHDQCVAEVHWSLLGSFNIENALAAIAASHYAGVSPELAGEALSRFSPVKRRLEVKGHARGVTVYDDFAHHPTAIAKTIQALKHSGRHRRILVVLEFASNTMKSGVHEEAMKHALDGADYAFILKPELFSLNNVIEAWSFPYQILSNTSSIIDAVREEAKEGDSVLIMSNRGFDGIHLKILETLNSASSAIFP